MIESTLTTLGYGSTRLAFGNKTWAEQVKMCCSFIDKRCTQNAFTDDGQHEFGRMWIHDARVHTYMKLLSVLYALTIAGQRTMRIPSMLDALNFLMQQLLAKPQNYYQNMNMILGFTFNVLRSYLVQQQTALRWMHIICMCDMNSHSLGYCVCSL